MSKITEIKHFALPRLIYALSSLQYPPKEIRKEIEKIMYAGVVPCGGPKTSPRTSTIVQFIFYFGPLRSAIIF